MSCKETVYAKITNTGNLPTLPEILTKLLEACEDYDRPLHEIAAIITKDPVLSYKVLQLVNSAYYGYSRHFSNVEQAVIYLGTSSIKNIAVTTAVHQVFEQKRFKKVEQFNLRQFWWHSLLCATLAKRIARKLSLVNSDEIYLSGLLHDIGRLVLVATFPEEHKTILAETKSLENVLWAENQLLGVTHGEIGGWLIRKWNLPSLMADAIAFHHAEIGRVAESFPLVKIVYYANLLSNAHLTSENHHDAGRTLLDLSPKNIKKIVNGATEEVDEIANSLGIVIQPPKSEKTLEEAVAEQDGQSARNTAQNTDLASSIDSWDEEPSAQQQLTARIKNVSLLSGFLENLVQAEKSEDIISAFEQFASVVFDTSKILFFLPDEHSALLEGTTSPSNPYHQMSKGVTLPLKRTSSKIVEVYHQMTAAYLTCDAGPLNPADQQVLGALQCRKVLLVPIKTENTALGIVLMGLPKDRSTLETDETTLLRVLAQQAGLCMYIERMKKRNAEQIEAEKMAAISLTAKKFAHEINNPLGIISNYLAALKFKLEGNDVKEELDIINEEIRRISSMVDQLDLFAKPFFKKTQRVSLNTVLEDIIQIAKTSFFGDNGTFIEFYPDTSLPDIQTARDGIKQIIINLLKNSSEAMQKGGTIEVTTRKIDAAGSHDKPKAGVNIIISDNGPGLPDHVQENLYKPFVTSKGKGHSGLGLSIVNKAVKDLGGRITCTTQPAEGTTFTIFLPLEIS